MGVHARLEVQRQIDRERRESEAARDGANDLEWPRGPHEGPDGGCRRDAEQRQDNDLYLPRTGRQPLGDTRVGRVTLYNVAETQTDVIDDAEPEHGIPRSGARSQDGD